MRACQVCRPNGYYSVVDHTDFTDLWAFCVLRLVIRFNNSGPDPDDILYDQPLGCAAPPLGNPTETLKFLKPSRHCLEGAMRCGFTTALMP